MLTTRWKHLVISLVSLGMVSACGTAAPGDLSHSNQLGQPQQLNAPTTPVPSANSPSSTGQSARPNEQTLTWQQEGETQSATGHLSHSNQQSFSLYILPKYRLVAEEPGKDVVLWDVNSQAWMRIEQFPSGTDQTLLRNNMKSQLTTVGVPEQADNTSMIPAVRDATIYHASNKNGSVTALLLMRNGIPFVATVFAPKEFESISPFLVMADTLVP